MLPACLRHTNEDLRKFFSDGHVALKGMTVQGRFFFSTFQASCFASPQGSPTNIFAASLSSLNCHWSRSHFGEFATVRLAVGAAVSEVEVRGENRHMVNAPDIIHSVFVSDITFATQNVKRRSVQLLMALLRDGLHSDSAVVGVENGIRSLDESNGRCTFSTSRGRS